MTTPLSRPTWVAAPPVNVAASSATSAAPDTLPSEPSNPPPRTVRSVGAFVAPETSACAVMDMTTIVLAMDASRVEAALAVFGRETFVRGERDTVPVVVELCRVKHGEMRAGGLNQSELYEWAGASSGAWLGAATGAVTGLIRSFRNGRAGASWVAPLEGALQGFVRGADGGRRSGRLASEIASQHFGRYDELIIGVPSVMVRGQGPYCAVLGMYTNSAFARGVDEALGYGFQKRNARFDATAPTTSSVSSPHGAPLLKLCLDSVGDPPPAAWVETVRGYHRQPLLGRRSNGALIASTFDRKSFPAPTWLSGRLLVHSELAPLFTGGIQVAASATWDSSPSAYVLRMTDVSVRLGPPVQIPGLHR